MSPEGVLLALLFVCGLLAGVFVIYLGLRQQSQHNEMRHRERMAMIERGQIPLEHLPGGIGAPRAGLGRSSRSLSVGIIVMGLGFALALLIGFAAGADDIAIGVGGAIVMVGASFVIRSLVVRPHPVDDSPKPPSITGI